LVAAAPEGAPTGKKAIAKAKAAEKRKGFADAAAAAAAYFGVAGWANTRLADTVAAKYDVSRAWVHRLIQRRRETGSLAPRKQTKFRRRVLAAREEERLALLITGRPDATLTELRDALPTTAALATLWRTIERLGFTLKKNGTRRRATPA